MGREYNREGHEGESREYNHKDTETQRHKEGRRGVRRGSEKHRFEAASGRAGRGHCGRRREPLRIWPFGILTLFWPEICSHLEIAFLNVIAFQLDRNNGIRKKSFDEEFLKQKPGKKINF